MRKEHLQGSTFTRSKKSSQ